MLRLCRSCKSNKLYNIISLGNLYLSDFITKNKKTPKHPLKLVVCEKCFLVQLKHTTPSFLLYTDNYGYKSGMNQTMKDHLKEIAEKSVRKVKNHKKKILAIDIGANDGTLLKFYPKTVYKVAVEPIKKLAKEAKKSADVVINDFFSYESYKEVFKDKKADIITAISCFYDIHNPNNFLRGIAKILKEDGIFVIQQNYLKSMLDQNAFDNVVHEHLEYYSLTSLQNLLRKHNLEVFDVEINNINGGSFRTYIAKKGKKKISDSVHILLQSEKKLRLNDIKIYNNFANRIKNNKEKIKKFILKENKKGKKIYVYGASTRGNTLLQY